MSNIQDEQEKKTESVINIHNKHKNWAENRLNNQFVNPLIDTSPAETLKHVSSVLLYVQDSLISGSVDNDVILGSDLRHGLFMINECIVNAVEFEQERALLIEQEHKEHSKH